MKRTAMRGTLRAAALAALFLLAAAGEGRGAMIARSLEELAAGATLVAEGTVVSVTSLRAGDPRAGIVTDVQIALAEVLKGGPAAAGEVVTVRHLGGELPGEDLGLRVSDQPSFTLNERALLFLAPDGAGRYGAVAAAQGVLAVEGEQVTFQGQAVALDLFKARVRELLR